LKKKYLMCRREGGEQIPHPVRHIIKFPKKKKILNPHKRRKASHMKE